jgi:hypothetical protein
VVETASHGAGHKPIVFLMEIRLILRTCPWMPKEGRLYCWLSVGLMRRATGCMVYTSTSQMEPMQVLVAVVLQLRHRVTRYDQDEDEDEGEDKDDDDDDDDDEPDLEGLVHSA